MANQNIGPDCVLARTTCPDCKNAKREIIAAEHFTTGASIRLDPILPIYVVKPALEHETGSLENLHVRPAEFFERKQLRDYAAAVAHHLTCPAHPPATPWPAWEPADNGTTTCRMASAACILCQQPIIWSTDYHARHRRIPMDAIPIYIVKRIVDAQDAVKAVYLTPREFLDSKNLGDYAFLIGHHANCPELHRRQRAQTTQEAAK